MPANLLTRVTSFVRSSPFAALCVAFLPLLLNAQDPTGTLEVRVVDPSSAVVSGSDVSAKNVQTGLTRTAKTSREGSYQFSNLPVGEYSLSVNAAGFAPFL